MDIVASSAPSVGHCNTMGTASTMNCLAEALGMSLPGCAAIPAPYRERGQIAYETGKRAVEIVWEDLKPSDILTRKAFENTIVVNSAIGGSTNAPIHINAIARHIGVNLSIEDWQKYGLKVPLLANVQPAGHYLCEEYHRAGGVPAVVNELMKKKLIHEDVLTVNGKSMGDNCRNRPVQDYDVIYPVDKPMREDAGFLVLKGNLFDNAVMKTSVISRGIPRPLFVESQGSRGVRRPRHRVRRAGGLSPPHRRSQAQDRRELHAVHARRGRHRLSRRG